jgi:hypothetical protein
MTGGLDGPYRIINFSAVTDTIKALYAQARVMGTEEPLRNCLAGIQQRLETEPVVFGEPLYNLYAMGLQVRVGLFPPLSVRFAVDEERRIVYVSALVLLGDLGPS